MPQFPRAGARRAPPLMRPVDLATAAAREEEMESRTHPPPRASLHWAVGMNHRNRVVCSLGLVLLFGAQLGDAQAPTWAYALLLLHMLLLPHVFLALTRRSGDPMASESRMMLLDAAMLGAWVGALHFPLWITVAVFASVSLHPMVFNGPRAFASALLLAVASGGLGAALSTWAPPSNTSVTATALAVAYLVLYLLALTHGAYANATLAIRLRRELKESQASLRGRLAEVESLQEQLREQALRDPLTDVYNRRYLDTFLEHELAQARRDRSPLSVMILDIDHFKQINDTHGHLAGDQVLRDVADLIRHTVRGSDILCRLGGEEFLVVLPGADMDGGIDLAQRLRAALEARPTRFDGRTISCTVSIGVAAYAHDGRGVDALIASADAALYEAKLGGRNLVVAAPPPGGRRPAPAAARPVAASPP